MAERALGWRRASAIAWRDLKSAPGKFAFVVLSVAVGVAALVGVRGFSESFRTTLMTESRSLMAGDLSARIFHVPSADELKKLAMLKQGIAGSESTWVTETISMASVAPDPVPLLISLKAVDPAMYPFYGAAQLEPQMSLQQALAGDSAVVADEFLIRLRAHVGDTLRLGGRSFKITAVLSQEPDRISAGAGMGPRVMISNAALDRTGLVAPGSRASHRLLMKLPAQADDATVRKKVEEVLPDAQVMDFKEGNPALSQGLDNATAILSLICLVAMVLGAIGVAMAMHAHLEQRMDMLAILKAVGAQSSDLLRIFLLQTMALGLLGVLIGVGCGALVMEALPTVFGKLLPVHTVLHFPWRAVGAGFGTGLLTTLLFCLPPLLDVRAVRPILVLRRMVEQGPSTAKEWVARWWARRLQLGIAVVVIAALGGIAWALSDSAKVGGWFALLFSIALIVLLLLAAVALRTLRFVLNRVRLRLPSSLRHGLANLYRPGNQSAAVLASLGTGVMLILAVYLMQSSLLREIRETASPKLPNVFLIDITPDEVDGVKAFFQHQGGVTTQVDLLPVVQGRFLTLNGKTLDQMQDQHFPRRWLENAEISWADAPPEGDKVLAGRWWKDAGAEEIAIGKGTADRLHLGVGSAVQLEVGGRTRNLKVAALYRPDGQHIGSRVSFMLPSGQLKSEQATWYGGAHIDAKKVPEMERALFAAYPTISVINIADVLTRIENVVDQIMFVVRFLAGFSILAGLMILASSIASARFRRMREAVVLKTLGATRMRIVRTFSVEFSVLGLLAGSVGVVFANLLTRVLLRRLEIGFHIDWRAAGVALVGTAILATATGWIASYRILGLRPLEVLREE
ncbi:ABC transporter permease [Occallatibacter savannae]|uniref:ABC transporter permease n=1 Tax=Occallatibacter savannae TaxID=1002691 RepID=UPI000D697078|nr:FtsX-like permease family protein [Occallatibacter savannae]